MGAGQERFSPLGRLSDGLSGSSTNSAASWEHLERAAHKQAAPGDSHLEDSEFYHDNNECFIVGVQNDEYFVVLLVVTFQTRLKKTQRINHFRHSNMFYQVSSII